MVHVQEKYVTYNLLCNAHRYFLGITNLFENCEFAICSNESFLIQKVNNLRCKLKGKHIRRNYYVFFSDCYKLAQGKQGQLRLGSTFSLVVMSIAVSSPVRSCRATHVLAPAPSPLPEAIYDRHKVQSF